MTINKQQLREAAQQCSAQEPLRIVDYHGKMCLRNSGGIVFTVLRDSSFPEYSSENENYARLAELSNTATVLALLDELEAAERRNAELEAREVKLPPNELVTDTWTAPGDGWEVFDAQKVIDSIRSAGVRIAAGITVKGE